MKKKAVFLDRDGNINKDVGYPNSYSLIEVYPFSYEAVREINQAGLLAVIITNQSGVGRGLIDEKNLQNIHKKMEDAFIRHNARIDSIYYCPHYIFSKDPKFRKDCSCRKPNPGLALQAAADLNIEISGSYMVGDKVEDILFGINLQICPILVLTGFGRESLTVLKKRGIQPAFVAENLLKATHWILEKENMSKHNDSFFLNSKKS